VALEVAVLVVLLAKRRWEAVRGGETAEGAPATVGGWETAGRAPATVGGTSDVGGWEMTRGVPSLAAKLMP